MTMRVRASVRAIAERQRDADDGARAGLRADFDSPAEQAGALFHADQPERAIGLADVETGAVVPNRRPDLGLEAFDGDPGVARHCVPADVRERFLDDAVQRRFDFGREPAHAVVGDHHVHAARFPELRGVALQCRHESQIVEGRRPQAARDPPDVPNRLPRQLTQAFCQHADVVEPFTQLWVPLSFRPEQITHDSNSGLVMARLKDGVSLAQAQAEMDVIAAQLASEFPQTNANRGVSAQPLHLNFVTESTRRNLWLLLGRVAFLLLIGCVNVANLLLARGTSRQREVALRAALGATRTRLFSQFLTESLVLAVLGGALGILLAIGIIDAITAVMPPVGTMLPSEANIRISVPVLLFTIGVTTLAGFLFGTAPAWQATRVDLNEVLKLGGRTGGGSVRRKALRLLVVAEFSLALTLLATGGLALRGVWNLTRIDLGIRTNNLLTFRLPVPDRRLNGPDQIRSYYGQMLERIQAVPGVAGAAAMTGMPARGAAMGTRFNIVGQPPGGPNERRGAAFQMVTADYAQTLGIQVTQGRSFDEHDTATSMRVAMVNEELVKRFFPNVDPLTQRLSIDEFVPGQPRGKPVEWQIVGVFHNTRGAGFREDTFEINVPFAQSPWPQMSMVVKTNGDPNPLIRSITGAVNSVDPDMPLAGMQTVDDIVSESLAIDRFSVVLFASFGVLDRK